MTVGLRPAFLDLAYRNPTFPHLAIECFRLTELRRRMKPSFFTRTQRPQFHILALYTDGQGLQEIDFVSVSCKEGTLVHVHPGQVVRYLSVAQAEAYMILFTPEFVPSASPEGDWLQLGSEPYAAVRTLFEAIEHEYLATDAGKVSEAIMRHMLMALLMQVDREAKLHRATCAVPPSHLETFTRFRAELERSFTQTRKVQYYADALGCSARTLNRATLALTGIPAKRFVDQRVALEAKRLLVHTTLTVSEIASHLDFSESTNFVKFFRRETGVLPGQFRESHTH